MRTATLFSGALGLFAAGHVLLAPAPARANSKLTPAGLAMEILLLLQPAPDSELDSEEPATPAQPDAQVEEADSIKPQTQDAAGDNSPARTSTQMRPANRGDFPNRNVPGDPQRPRPGGAWSPRDLPDRSGREPQRQGPARDRNRGRQPLPDTKETARRSPNDTLGGTNGPAQLNYAAFKIISDRNIFDTTRSSRSAQNRRNSQRPARTDTLTWVGVLSSEKGTFAFFDGSSSEFRKVLETGKSVAGHKITSINPQSVTLTTTNNTIELRVGSQMRREDGDWRVAGGSGSAAALQASTTAESGEPSSSASADDESDVVKKLMRLREQELK
jgi:hypothetical protein